MTAWPRSPAKSRPARSACTWRCAFFFGENSALDRWRCTLDEKVRAGTHRGAHHVHELAEVVEVDDGLHVGGARLAGFCGVPVGCPFGLLALRLHAHHPWIHVSCVHGCACSVDTQAKAAAALWGSPRRLCSLLVPVDSDARQHRGV